MRLPVLVASATGAVLTCLAVRDPNTEGAYPLCPFRALTGWDCPGCGSLRGLHALATGRPGETADQNLLLLLAVPFLVWRFVAWSRDRWRGFEPRGAAIPAAWIYTVLAGVLIFWFVRNLPGVPFLGSGIG
jgi:hypothetical protein